MAAHSLEHLIKEIRRLVEDDDTEQAIEELKNYLHSNVPELYNELLTQAARHRRLLRDERAGLLTREQSEVEKVKIAKALLSLLSELPGKVEQKLTPVGGGVPLMSEALAIPEEITPERILGINNLKQISWIERGVQVCKSVCRILTPDGLGTGFLVGAGIIMTNNHVIPSTKVAANSEVEFDYQQDGSGQLLPTYRYGLDIAEFHTSVALDYTLVRVKPEPGKPPLKAWGRLRLNPNADPRPSEHVSIVQHPNGGLKQIVLTSNWVIGKKSPILQYTTDTMGGSSGSPVFNDSWHVVAIHHAAVSVKDKGKQRYVNEGILMSAIKPDAGDLWPKEATRGQA
jgi:endonuclease G